MLVHLHFVLGLALLLFLGHQVTVQELPLVDLGIDIFLLVLDLLLHLLLKHDLLLHLSVFDLLFHVELVAFLLGSVSFATDRVALLRELLVLDTRCLQVSLDCLPVVFVLFFRLLGAFLIFRLLLVDCSLSLELNSGVSDFFFRPVQLNLCRLQLVLVLAELLTIAHFKVFLLSNELCFRVFLLLEGLGLVIEFLFLVVGFFLVLLGL